MKKAVQQIMLGTVTKNEKQTAETLRRIKAAGYDGIELNGFMVKPTSFLVRMLTKAAGMPVGKGGSYDWNALVKEAGLCVTSIHEDLGTIDVYKRQAEGHTGRGNAAYRRGYEALRRDHCRADRR